MHSFSYERGWLTPEGTATSVLQALGEYRGPALVYSKASILRRTRAYQTAFAGFDIHYAMKANHNKDVLRTLKSSGVKVDVVSIGEAELAMQVGFGADEIIFSGVGKTRSEIHRALQAGISQLNVESPQELKRIAEIARSLRVCAPVAFRLNPDVNAKTHPYIATGFRENKFGMDSSFIPDLLHILRNHESDLQLVGLTFHIGSQLFDLESFSQSLDKLIDVYKSLREQGFAVSRLDVGGGIGINYQNGDESDELKFLQDYGVLVRQKMHGLHGIRLQCEPGRFLVARSGVLVSQIQYVKVTPFKKFLILDTGMHHLLRPALYDAHHRIVPMRDPGGSPMEVCDVVGPICESADFLAKSRPLSPMVQDDFVAIMDAGAYASVMASDYNCQARAIEIVV